MSEMSNQLFEDVAQIRIDVAVTKNGVEALQKQLDRHMNSHMRWSIAMSVCFVASVVSVFIAVVT